MTRAALLLALAVVFQSLRLFIPVPLPVNMFLIGSLVNACLILAAWETKLSYAVGLACITPWIAYLQGQLPFLPFVFPVALGNSLFAAWHYWKKGGIWNAFFGAGIKMCALYGGFCLLFSVVHFPGAVQAVILFAMSWPQLVTGILGGMLAFLTRRYVKK